MNFTQNLNLATYYVPAQLPYSKLVFKCQKQKKISTWQAQIKTLKGKNTKSDIKMIKAIKTKIKQS